MAKNFAHAETTSRNLSTFQNQLSWDDNQSHSLNVNQSGSRSEETWLTLRENKRRQKPKEFRPLPPHLQSPEAIKGYINSRGNGAETVQSPTIASQGSLETYESSNSAATLIAAKNLTPGSLEHQQATAQETTSTQDSLKIKNSTAGNNNSFQGTNAPLESNLSQDRKAENQLITPAQSKKLLALGLDNVAITVAKRALVWLASKGANISGHVAKRHIANYLGKSMFSSGGKAVKNWTIKALKSPDKIVDQGRRIVFEKKFGREIGRGGEKIIRVVVDKSTGKIVTAFPTSKFLSLSPAALGIASMKAREADAQIKSHRERIEQQNQPSLIERAVDLLVGVEPVGRDESGIEERKIVEKNIQEAIKESQKKLKKNLSVSEKQQIKEILLLEMNLTE
jgi:hypothetical protein